MSLSNFTKFYVHVACGQGLASGITAPVDPAMQGGASRVSVLLCQPLQPPKIVFFYDILTTR